MEKKQSSSVFKQFGKDIASVICGTMASYFLVQMISFSIMERKLYYFIDDKILMHLFSYQMIPPFVAFAILIGFVYYLYQKTKHTMALLNKSEIEREHEKAVIETTQAVSAIIIGSISQYNTIIKDWLEKKRERGEQPPLQIAYANEKISLALQTMSEQSYLLPYTEARGIKLNVAAFTERLEERLNCI